MNEMNPNNAKTWVGPSGVPTSASYIIVGEQPGRVEVSVGKPFAGPAGSILDECLQSAEIARDECYITNTIKDLDRPLSYYFDSKMCEFKAPALPYLDVLSEELAACKAKIVIAVGGVALKALTGRSGITNWRGSIIESTLNNDKTVVPCFHPATVIPPKNVFTNKWLIIKDIAKAKGNKNGIVPNYGDIVKIYPSYKECLNIIDYFLSKRMHAFDIETYHGQISCISFADYNVAVSIPFIDGDGQYFSPEHELGIWRKIAQLLENKDIKSIAHNAVFDCSILFSLYGIKVRNIEDSMIAQSILNPDYSKGLAFAASIYTNIPYYKGVGKQWFKEGGPWQDLWHYNAMDSYACYCIYKKQIKELAATENLPAYQRQRNLVYPLVYMNQRGINIDPKEIASINKILKEQEKKINNEIKTMAGKAVNIDSPAQVRGFIYNSKKNYKVYVDRKTKKPTVNETALIRLARQGCEEANLILKAKKIKGTIGKLNKSMLTNGRIHPCYNPVGNRYGKITSSSDIYSKGVDLEKIEDSYWSALTVDEGYLGVAIEFYRLEENIISNYINSKDLDIYTDCKELFYGMGYKAFSLLKAIPEKDGKKLYDSFHNSYPKINTEYFPMIEEQVLSGRVLTNLTGRKQKFMGRFDNALLLEAYKYIPKSTANDIINDRGINHIYHHVARFRDIQLLGIANNKIFLQVSNEENDDILRCAEMLWSLKRELERPLTINGEEFTIPVILSIFHKFSQRTAVDMQHSEIYVMKDIERLLEEL
jgi:uracil-DNA glycosylase family 4